MAPPATFDVEAYLARIHARADGAPGLALLEALHAAHLAWVPFENIDVFLGRPRGLDLETLQAKIVRVRRGGYCFEQNTLFAAALRALGYPVQTLEARVRPAGATKPLPRTHMLLRVDVEGRAYLADVGFGGDGPLVPVPLDGSCSSQPDGAYRVDREGEALHVLRLSRAGLWHDLYAFTLTPAEPVDFAVAHHYTSTHPRSPFVQNLTAQRRDARERHILRGRRYTRRREGEETSREIAIRELGPLLEDVFRLRLDDDVLGELTRALARQPLD